MKRPSFQFYPGDWSSNPNLKRCTFAEKGIWLEVLCLMHDQPEYGVLRWPLKEIAEAVKCRVADLQVLQRKDVLKGHDQALAEPFIYVPRSGRKDGEPVTLVPVQAGPLWYSSRMVKDEYVRTIRGESTRFGDGNGETPKHSPKPPIGDGSSSSSSSSSSTSVDTSGKGGKPPVDQSKTELWKSAVSLLDGQGMPEAQARSFIGKLSKDYSGEIVLDAVRGAVTEQPADARAYLKATCQRLAGEKARSAQAQPAAWEGAR